MGSYFATLSLITGIVWAFTPFRQRKGVYFYFFLVLSLGELIVLLDRYLLQVYSNVPYIFIGCLLIPALRHEYLKSKILLTVIIVFTLFSTALAASFKNYYYELAILVFVHVIVTMLMFVSLTKAIAVENTLPGFLIVLIFMELLDILKLFNILLKTPLGLYYFYVNHFASLLLALFFCFFTENTPFLIFRFKSQLFSAEE